MADMGIAETLAQEELHQQALRCLEAFLGRTTHRLMFSSAELQNLALDLHNILDPIS